jgi:hypothetical protein
MFPAALDAREMIDHRLVAYTILRDVFMGSWEACPTIHARLGNVDLLRICARRQKGVDLPATALRVLSRHLWSTKETTENYVGLRATNIRMPIVEINLIEVSTTKHRILFS